MLRNSNTVALFLCMTFSCCVVFAQDSEPKQLTENPIIDSPYVTVYGAGGVSGVTIHHPKTKHILGRVFLTGRSDKENSKNVYLIAWDSIELIRYPNPEYEKKPAVATRKVQAELPVKFQLDKLASELDNMDTDNNQLAQRLAWKHTKIKALSTELDKLKDGNEKEMVQEEVNILTEEYSIQEKRLSELRAEHAKRNLDYLKKRRDAIVKGEMN